MSVKLDRRWLSDIRCDIHNADYTSNQIQSNDKPISHYSRNHFHFRSITRVTYDIILLLTHLKIVEQVYVQIRDSATSIEAGTRLYISISCISISVALICIV